MAMVDKFNLDGVNLDWGNKNLKCFTKYKLLTSLRIS